MRHASHALLLALGLTATAHGAVSAADAPAEAALKHAKALLDKVPLVDGHNDLPWSIRQDKAHPMDVDAYDLRKLNLSLIHI